MATYSQPYPRQPEKVPEFEVSFCQSRHVTSQLDSCSNYSCGTGYQESQDVNMTLSALTDWTGHSARSSGTIHTLGQPRPQPEQTTFPHQNYPQSVTSCDVFLENLDQSKNFPNQKVTSQQYYPPHSPCSHSRMTSRPNGNTMTS